MKYFIIVDMQNDFTFGALENDSAKKIIPNIIEAAKEYKEKGYKIIATRDTHEENYLLTQEGKLLPVKHCIKDTEGWEVVEDIKPLVEEYVDKPTFGFLGWKDVLSDVEEVVLVGTCTSICVGSNATIIKAQFPEAKIACLGDLCADINSETHNAGLRVMTSQQVKVEDFYSFKNENLKIPGFTFDTEVSSAGDAFYVDSDNNDNWIYIRAVYNTDDKVIVDYVFKCEVIRSTVLDINGQLVDNILKRLPYKMK